MIWLLFGPSVRQERASGRLLELPMPSPVWKFIATTTMCAQGKEGSPLRAVYGGSRIARSDLLTGSPFPTEGSLREEGPHLSPLRAICGRRGPGSTNLASAGAADKDGDHRMEVSIDPLGGRS